MIYVIDTCVFRKLLDHLPRKGSYFEKVWNKFENGIETKIYISVDECFNELDKHYDDKSSNALWLKKYKDMFLSPTNDESLIIKEIFTSAKMRESVHTKNILDNRPSTDVFLAAKAKTTNAIVVTVESYKPNSAQLPNICEKIGVQFISYDDFMEILMQDE
mgnify:FL=1